ncbi:MAG: nucleoside triphosphate pyrophosphohydrolase [Candidatus Microgenomates bacterium]|jgi:predicted house-cleaning noncanonical NTP pyrophosphatase (MazG superfamily)
MERKYIHNKLVRDKIPQVIKASGGEGKIKILSEKRFEEELKKKLIEEAKELNKASKEEIVNELADVLELTKSIAAHYKIKFSKVEKFMMAKRKKRGGFRKKLFLVWSTGKAGK